MAFLREFEFDIRHMKGKENKVVDGLSRHAHSLKTIIVISIKTTFLDKIKNSMHKDTEYQERKQKLQQV